MAFSDTLNTYMDRYSITVTALSEKSGVSKATISRFKNGKREPAAHGDVIGALANAISELSQDSQLTEERVNEELSSTLSQVSLDFDQVTHNLNVLIDVFDININDLSRYLKFDPSYLSRIRSGQRKPANQIEFCNGVARFVSSNFSEGHLSTLSRLLGCPLDHLEDPVYRKNKVFEWLTEGQPQQDSSVVHFLQQLDEFDLNEYIQAIHFDKLKVPTTPFQLPISKSVFTLKGFMQAELDWLKATALSKSEEPVLLYSDMPMADMSKDGEFPKKWMFGMALMLKKGLHLDVIHNVDRSLDEMMLGLEGWIPLYMTGQVSSYYLKGYSDSVFSHFLRVSGAAAVSGEAIVGAHESGVYHLTKNKDELANYRKRGEDLLKKATPLIETYTEEDEDQLEMKIAAKMEKRGIGITEIAIAEQAFKNIKIRSLEGECVIVSKSNSPKIHFVIRHPKLREAIENLSIPIVG